MYNKFFGFKEKPFKLVPNPEYLFLSKSHEEALGHLTYAISHGDGFVEITGEVGTGKTTLCRVFLGSLDASIEAAYIFNPKLDALQLLKAINDEFGIDSNHDNTKDLIDILNGFLIEKKAAGQKVLVLIDEAQNLSLEVLEQLRLLSNLETTQEKLLQIILVGQPELGAMLSSHQLRQLGQRITINCQLEPLTFQETKDYIRHRISLASHRAIPPFDKTSYRVIYEYSRGVPRLINIACDRVLLNAFSRNSFNITGSITREAIKELTRKKSGSANGWITGVPGLVIVCAFFISLIILLLYLANGQPPKTPVINKSSPEEITQAEPEQAVSIPEKFSGTDITPEEPITPQEEEPITIQKDILSQHQPEEFGNNTEVLETPGVINIATAKLKKFVEPLATNEKALDENIPEDTAFHSVHVGTFQSASLANERLEEMKALGYPSFIYTRENSAGKTTFMVVAGQYPSYELAKEASRNLGENGYNNFVSRAKDSLVEETAIAIPQPQTNLSEQQPQTGIIEQQPQTDIAEPPLPTSGDPQNFLNYLQGLKSRFSRNSSMEHILNLWFPKKETLLNQSGIETAEIFFRETANQHGLHMQSIATESNIALIQNLNVPVIFTFYIIGHTWPKYLAVTAIDKNKIYFVDEEQNKIIPVAKEEFLKYWSGETYIFWKNFAELHGTLTPSSKSEEIKTLKQLLLQLGYNNIPMTDKYDKETLQVIKNIQAKYGLHADGLVGPLTKIALYNENSSFAKPGLRQIMTTDMRSAE